MKHFLIIFVTVILISCNNLNHNKIIFQNTLPYETIDFKALSENTNSKITKTTFNLKKASISLPEGQFSVFIVDLNKNQVFNDLDEDVYIVSQYGRDLPHSFNISNKLSEENIFSINNSVFSIKNITLNKDRYYAEVKLTKLPLDSVQKHNRLIDKIPKNNFCNVKNNKTLSFENFLENDKLIFIEFWTTWCTKCINDIPTLKKIHREYGEEITIISLNSNSKNHDLVKDFVLDNNMDWYQGFTNDSIRNKMGFIFPRGYLFDQHGNIIDFYTSPQKVLNQLQDSSIFIN